MHNTADKGVEEDDEKEEEKEDEGIELVRIIIQI
jgi:hypothetical protein